MSYIGNSPTTTAFVTDTFNGNGSTTVFTMSLAPATTSSILVSITGVLQDPSTYSVSGTTLTFSAAPPSGTGNVSVRYLGIPASGVTTTAYRTVTEFTATAGQTTFNTPSYTVGYIDVYRNGVRLGSSDFTASNGTTVVLAAACNAGDLVVTESFYVSSVLNAIPATAGAVSNVYLGSGVVAQSNLATGVAGTGPAFSAYQSVQQTGIANGVFTKVQLQTEVFDTNNNFDKDVNYRFTPTVAGYYSIVGTCAFGAAGIIATIYKNGSEYARGGQGSLNQSVASTILYCNGSTDYVELYVYQGSGSPQSLNIGTVYTCFSGCLVRAA